MAPAPSIASLTPAVRSDLLRIAAHAELRGDRTRVAAAIHLAIAAIPMHWRPCPFHGDPGEGLRRSSTPSGHVVYFRVDEVARRIDVELIAHAREDVEALLARRRRPL